MNVAHKDIDVYSPKKANNKAAFTKEEKESFDRLLALDLVDTFRQLYP